MPFYEIKGKNTKEWRIIGFSTYFFNESNEKNIEVHILDFDQNIYEQQIKVYFIAFSPEK